MFLTFLYDFIKFYTKENIVKFNTQHIPGLPKFITVKSDSEISEIIIADDGPGFPKDILNKIGEPYIRSLKKKQMSETGLGLGIFIGKTLLEKNFAKLTCRNSETRGGAEINITWKNKDLSKI